MRDGVAAASLWWRAWRYRLRLDPAEIAWIRRHVSAGSCAVDVGAHKGGYTYWLSRCVGDAGRVVSFEPQPGVCAELRRAVAAAGLRNVTVEPVAVSDRVGEATLALPAGSSTCGASLEARERPRETLTVATTTLDAYAAARPGMRVGFVKCDVEGHELAVFRGALRLLEADRPALLFECEARHHRDGPIDEVFRFLEARGYQGSFFERGRRAPLSSFRPEMQRHPGEAGYVNNFLFTAA